MIKVKCISCNLEDDFTIIEKHCRKMNHNVFEGNRVNVIVDPISLQSEFIEYSKKYFKRLLTEEFDYLIESFNEDVFPTLEGDDIDDAITNKTKFLSDVWNKIQNR